MEVQFIQKTIEDLLNKMGVEAEIEVKDDEDAHMTVFAIKAAEPQVLIGHRGETLTAFSHIVKKIADKHDISDEKLSFIVDVNDYQRKKIRIIKDKATILAERARYFKSSVEMDPMSPYERMIVHSIFSEKHDINTESVGRGRERRIVIKYIGD